jgi:hypothetical protein
VVDGHQYVVAGKSVEQPAAYSYVAGEPKSYQTTVPIAPPALPAAAAPIIPPAPRNYAAAPLDTVTQVFAADIFSQIPTNFLLILIKLGGHCYDHYVFSKEKNCIF